MKVAVYYNNSDVRIEERPTPEIGDGEILVRIMASGICGTDAVEWYRIKKAPRVLGHEIAGEIVRIGNEVKGLTVGDRVFVSHHVPCYDCKYCNAGHHTACETLHTGNFDPGGFSEYVRVPEINVRFGTYALPETVSYSEGAMIEPLACAVRAMKVGRVAAGSKVLVLGCGISGIMNIQEAKLLGAEVVATDVSGWRLEKAGRYGADRTVHASETLPADFDCVILCTGAMPAVEQAFRCLDRKGIFVFFAIPGVNPAIPIVDFWRNEMTVTATYGAAPEDLAVSLSQIADGKVDMKSVITHRLPLDRIQEGFDIVARAGESLKVVVYPFGV